LSSFRPNLALDFEGGHVFFEMPSLLTQKRALQVSTWSLLCLGLVPSGGKALLGGTIAQLQVAHNPKRGRFFNQSTCLVIHAVGRWKKQTADFSVTVSSQFHI